MCLALPGKILALYEKGDLLMGEVDFSGVIKEICLFYTPEVKFGDYVIVHVGFSIAILNEKEAHATLNLMNNEDEHEVCR